MADLANNSTGDLEPDGIDDSLASTLVKQKIEFNLGMVAAGGRSEELKQQADLAITEEDMAAALAAYQASQPVPKTPARDVSQPVIMNPGSRVPGSGASTNNLNIGYTGRNVTPVNTLMSQGVDELYNQPIFDSLSSLVGNEYAKYDGVYKAAVNQAAIMQKQGKPISVEQLLDRWNKGGAPDSIKKYINGSGGDGAGGAFSTVNRSVSLSDAGTARMVLSGALSRYLGRQASTEENAAFLNALNVQEKANPTITKTSGYSNGSGSTTANSSTTGGFNRDDFATRFAKSQQGYAEYQTATTYLDAFANALESDSRVI